MSDASLTAADRGFRVAQGKISRYEQRCKRIRKLRRLAVKISKKIIITCSPAELKIEDFMEYMAEITNINPSSLLPLVIEELYKRLFQNDIVEGSYLWMRSESQLLCESCTPKFKLKGHEKGCCMSDTNLINTYFDQMIDFFHIQNIDDGTKLALKKVLKTKHTTTLDSLDSFIIEAEHHSTPTNETLLKFSYFWQARRFREEIIQVKISPACLEDKVIRLVNFAASRNCPGCKIMSGGQQSHMGSKGCMGNMRDKVEDYFDDAGDILSLTPRY